MKYIINLLDMLIIACLTASITLGGMNLVLPDLLDKHLNKCSPPASIQEVPQVNKMS